MPAGGGTTRSRRQALSGGGSNEGGGRGSYVYTNRGGKQYARGQESPPSSALPTYTYDPVTGHAAPTPYAPPAPRGYAARGPSGRTVFHTYAGWQAVRAAQAQAHARAQGTQRALSAFGGLAGAIQGLLGRAPGSGAPASAHADYRRGVGLIGGLLRATQSPQAAAQAGRTLGTGARVAGGLARSIGTGEAIQGYAQKYGYPTVGTGGTLRGGRLTAGNPLRQALQAGLTPGDVVSGLGKLGSAIAHPTGPLGARGDLRPTPQQITSGLAQLGHAIAYPAGPLGQRIEQKFGGDRPSAIAGAGQAAGNLIAQGIRAGRNVQASAYPLSGRLLPHDVRQAQYGGAAFGTALASDVPNLYAGIPSVAFKAVTDPAGLAKDAWQTDPILSSIRTGSLAPLAKGLSEHPILTAAELRGGFAAGHRLVGTAGRPLLRPQPGTLDRMGSAFSTAPEQVAITTNDLRGVGQRGTGRPVLTTERTFSRSPGVNYLQRRAEVGRAPGQAAARMLGHTDLRTGKTTGGGWVAEAARMRKAGVDEATIRARVRMMRNQRSRIDFLEDKRIVSERQGRKQTEAVAGGVGGPRFTRHAIADRKVRQALRRTEIAGQILNDHVKPGHIVEDLHARLADLAAESKNLPDGELMADNLRERALIAKALRRPELAKASSATVLAAKIKTTPDLALLDKPYPNEPVHPELGVKVGRGFRALTPHAEYVRNLIEPELAQQGLLPEWRRKAALVPGLVAQVGARAGTRADEYVTDAGKELRRLREHSRDLTEHHGNMVAEHRRAQGAAAEAVKVASNEARVAQERTGTGVQQARESVETRRARVRLGQVRRELAALGRTPEAKGRFTVARGGGKATGYHYQVRDGQRVVDVHDALESATQHAELLNKRETPKTGMHAGDIERRHDALTAERIRLEEHLHEAKGKGKGERDASLRTERGPVAVKKLEQALRSVRTHLRRAASAYSREDHPNVTRHREAAKAAEQRALEATRNLSPRVAARVREAIAHEHAAEQAAIEARRDARERVAAYDAHAKGMKDAGVREKRTPWMVDAHGRPIETEAQAREMLTQAGAHLESTAHVGLRGDTSSSGAYHGGTADVKSRFISGQQRTGEATRYGLGDLSHEAVVEDLHRKRVRVEFAKAHAELMQGGVMHEEPFTWLEDAKNFMQGIIGRTVRDEHGEGTDYVPETGMPQLVIRDMAPFFKRADEIERRNAAIGLSRRGQHGESALDEELMGALHDTLTTEPAGQSGAGRYVVMPKDFIDQMAKHGRQAGGSDFYKSWQAIQQQFRKTVLLTSMKWIAGNGIEMIFRLAFHGIGPKALVTGHRLQRAGRAALGEQGWNDVLAGTAGEGGHFGFALERGQRYRGPEAMSGAAFKEMAKIAQGVRRGKLNPIAALGQVWDVWGRTFGGFNTMLEHQGRLAVMGATASRDVRDFNNNVMAAIHVGRGALEDTAKGLVGTARQERYARRIDQVLGQYSRFTPGQRRLLEVAPFFPWYLNALRFFAAQAPLVGKTPVRTAAMIAAYNGEAKRLKKEGHTLEPIGFKGKAFLATGTSDVPGGHMPTGRFLPYGALDTSALPGLLFPEITGALGGAGGQDFTGKAIDPGSHPVGINDLMAVSLNSFIEGLIPGVAMLRRFQEGGGTSAQTSTVFNPQVKVPGTKAPQPAPGSFLEHGLGALGSLPAGAEKTLNPLHVIPQATLGKGSGSANPLHNFEKQFLKPPSGQLAPGDFEKKYLKGAQGSVSRFASTAQSSEGPRRTSTMRYGTTPLSVRDPIQRGAGRVRTSWPRDRVQGDIPQAEQKRLLVANAVRDASRRNQYIDRMTVAERRRAGLVQYEDGSWGTTSRPVFRKKTAQAPKDRGGRAYV